MTGPENNIYRTRMATSKRKKPDGYSEEDFRIALGIIILGTRERAAKFAGVSERTIYYRLEQNSDWLDQAMTIVEECMRLRRIDVEEVTEDQFLPRLYEMFGKTAALLEEAVEKGDVRTAMELFKEAIHYKKGKPASTLKIEGEVEHNHRVLPPTVDATLKQFESALPGMMIQPMLPVAEEEIPEAEIVG